MQGGHGVRDVDTVRTAPASSCWTCAAVVWASCEVYRVACSCPKRVALRRHDDDEERQRGDDHRRRARDESGPDAAHGRSSSVGPRCWRSPQDVDAHRPSLTRTAHATANGCAGVASPRSRSWGWDVSGSGARDPLAGADPVEVRGVIPAREQRVARAQDEAHVDVLGARRPRPRRGRGGSRRRGRPARSAGPPRGSAGESPPWNRPSWAPVSATGPLGVTSSGPPASTQRRRLSETV